MPDTRIESIFDTEPDEAVEARLDAEALAAYRAGDYVLHARVRDWLARLATGERVPPPET